MEKKQTVTLELVRDPDPDEKKIPLRPSIRALGDITDVNALATAIGVDRKTILNAISWHEGMRKSSPPGVMRLGRRIKIEVVPFLAWLKSGEAGR